LFTVRPKNNGLGQSTANPEFAYGGDHLEVMNSNGTNRTPIFTCPDPTHSLFIQPSWSAEGNGTAATPWHIAFVCNSADFWDVWRLDLDTAGGEIHGTNAVRLAVGAGFPASSPATDEVAFANVQASPQVLEVVSASGGARQVLYTPSSGAVYMSAWRSNGSHLAFIEGGDGNSRIRLLERATGTVTTLVGPGVFGSIRFVDWARHRDALAFSASPVGGGGESVYTLELDANLSPVGTPKRIVAGAGPSWSPDDRKLAYVNSRLLTIDLATGKKTGVAARADWPDWRR
jgi:Tol biopolymer transport system component